jgi:hypothetical protein
MNYILNTTETRHFIDLAESANNGDNSSSPYIFIYI